MAHRLNTNKQFMIGNGILAFAVIFVVVIFVYMSMRLQQRKEGERNFIETYTITLTKGFAGDSTFIFINDSLLVNRTIAEEPFTIEVKRFAEQNALMIVNNATEKLSLFELSEIPVREGRGRGEAAGKKLGIKSCEAFCSHISESTSFFLAYQQPLQRHHITFAVLLQRHYTTPAVTLQRYCTPFAALLQNSCSVTAKVLQQHCKRSAVTVQEVCSSFAVSLSVKQGTTYRPY